MSTSVLSWVIKLHALYYLVTGGLGLMAPQIVRSITQINGSDLLVRVNGYLFIVLGAIYLLGASNERFLKTVANLALIVSLGIFIIEIYYLVRGLTGGLWIDLIEEGLISGALTGWLIKRRRIVARRW